MRRTMAVLAMTTATMLASATVEPSAQAVPEPARSAGSTQQVRDPSGHLVTTDRHPATPGQQNARKAPPPVTATTTGTGTGCTYRTTSQYFCRAGAYQYVTSDGAYMSTPVQSPVVATADYHSLAEMAVQSADGQQIIEIGWRVYRPQDQTPRLFIFHWVNGQPTCYNAGCGFVQSTSTTITPGMALTPSSTPTQFAIEYFQGNWWYGYNGTWFGYLPGTLWTSPTFTKAGLVQEFGEVSTSVVRPCTNMGNGIIGTNASAAAVTGVGYYNSTTATSLSRGTVDDATLYDSQVTSTTSFRYGGPGAC